MTERAAALQRTLLSVENNAGGKNSTLELSDKGTTMHQIKSLMTERRVMLGTIIGLLLAMLLMLIATSTDHWARLSFLPRHRADRKVSVVGYHTGIWRICFYEIHKKDLPLPIATTSANAMNPVVSTTSALNSVSVEPTSDYNGTNPSGGSLHGFKPRLPGRRYNYDLFDYGKQNHLVDGNKLKYGLLHYEYHFSLVMQYITSPCLGSI